MVLTLEQAEADYKGWLDLGLKIDMTRGKPSPEQLRLSVPMLQIPFDEASLAFEDPSGAMIDIGNYGHLAGIPAARSLMGEFLGISEQQVLIGGNSSLQLMETYVDFFLRTQLNGFLTTEPKFLMPSPGYDRHGFICEKFGIKMIPVAFNEDGPDMDQCEELVRNDSSIVGIFVVPKYSNPTGHVNSPETNRRISNLPNIDPSRPFVVICDDAYRVHDLYEHIKTRSMMQDALDAGTEDKIAVFGSTSKVTFAGGGISAIGLSTKNLSAFEKYYNIETIGGDKINQYRHVIFLQNLDNVITHMERHAAILRPKFEAVQAGLKIGLGDEWGAKWNKDVRGGYFVSFDTPDGYAKEVVKLAKEAGVVFTDAGATFPNRNDPNDSNIRIAPSCPSVDQINQAMEVLSASLKLALLRND